MISDGSYELDVFKYDDRTFKGVSVAITDGRMPYTNIIRIGFSPEDKTPLCLHNINRRFYGDDNIMPEIIGVDNV